MKVLLIGNYINSRQQSMQRFAEMLRRGLEGAGHDVRLVRPPVLLGRLRSDEAGLAKWIGYIDRYVLFMPLLGWKKQWADVVHICADAMYVSSVRSKPHVITCHDVFAIRAARDEIPESPTSWTGKIYQQLILHNLRSAQLLVCVSEQTQKEAQQVTCLPKSRFAVVPNALNYPYQPVERAKALVKLKQIGMDSESPFFLHVGGNQWYKNRRGVLQIFAELAKKPPFQSHRLLMVGKLWTAELRQVVRNLQLSDRVIEVGEVPDGNLCALYSTAEALLFPSLQEGFGWPIAEAQACGCPVITTARSPMTFVAGDAAIYIDPSDAAGAAKTISAALADPEHWRKAGLENALRFSEEKMINGYVQCYHNVSSKLSSNVMK